ncbi:hypothetical protein Sango_2959300 [Sesamum angolense]|uniref:Reverse transcriptase Ty1/copia-type domain-containing protein n=1 Tax=Sesamum angolense TaxID=2727404 RepID=A0AAE1T3A8_9LAMI|nr:hypothetical protein Sango_2959300 [Sesamum angolense]
MQDMSDIDVILGIKLIRSTDGIVIFQSHYVEKIIERFGYQNSRIARAYEFFLYALFENKSGVSVAQLRSSQIIGSYSIWEMARDQIFHFPSLSWLDTLVVLTKPIGGALDRVLRYLKGTVSLAIHYGRFPAVLEGYRDAS